MLTRERPMSDPPALPALRMAAVTLCAPSRLHLGFLDPGATLGRRFGSIGLAIDGFDTVVRIAAGDTDAVTAATPAAERELPRALRHLQLLRDRTGCRTPLALHLLQVPPAHAGFGSGTQLALAVGRAFALAHGLEVATATLAQWLGRGTRSGIGIAGFDHGGLLVDGGPSADARPAPLLARIALPAAWRVLVVRDATLHGLSGADERHAIATLPPLPQAAAADICHQVLMRVLPGAAQGDFDAFAAGIGRVQQLLGAHFAPAQGGSAWTSAAVCRVVGAIGASQGAAIGQSSWGPTGFAILPSAAAANAALQVAQSAGGVAVQVVGASNHGATVARIET